MAKPCKASIKLIKPSHSRMKGGHNRRGGNITSYISYHLPNAINLWGWFTRCGWTNPAGAGGAFAPRARKRTVSPDSKIGCRDVAMAGLPVASRRCRCSGHASGYLSHFQEVNLTSSYFMLVWCEQEGGTGFSAPSISKLMKTDEVHQNLSRTRFSSFSIPSWQYWFVEALN